MMFQRVWGRRAVVILAWIGLAVAAAGNKTWGQSNLFAVGLSLRTDTPSDSRPWSADLNQILFLPQVRDNGAVARNFLSSNPRSGRASDVATNRTDAVFQEPWSTIDEARMDLLMRRIEEGGYGTSTAERDRSALSRAMERSVNTLFMPEPIKLGHAQLGFSPYTAIKRKNPFCLLNPIPLALSW